MESFYREFAPPANLSHIVSCVWEQRLDNAYSQRIIPDGCVDLVWMSDSELVWVGADTKFRIESLPSGSHLAGVRLRIGAAGVVLGIPASEVRDVQVQANDIWKREGNILQEKLLHEDPMRRLQLMIKSIEQRNVIPDGLVLQAFFGFDQLGVTVASVARDLGVSERTLNRRVTAAVGYGPKMLARVARLRKLVRNNIGTLTDRSYVAGYASQSHMCEEVRLLTGISAVRFLKDARLTSA